MTELQLAVVMPAFNEEPGIEDFLREIQEAADRIGWSVRFGVVDDASTDGTVSVLSAAAEADAFEITVRENAVNSGHGPTSRRAWELGLELGAPIVVHVDGDGQYTGEEILRVAQALADGAEAAIGVRTSRSDPWFRRLLSWSAATYVRWWVREGPLMDVNAPLRGFRAEVLRNLIAALPADPVVPSIYLTAMTRLSLPPPLVRGVPVTSRERRGGGQGSTWGTRRFALVPPARLILLAVKAAVESAHVLHRARRVAVSDRARV